ncbi:hypothetical protein Csa_016117 [Cucumis sativus]|uniref:25S rRNA (uridine-N(3))-methyltransferase BMT5-like domain-containing protein n=1 Tax=Cucumis sativus TaxID=3659 RepID=A0A0A0K3N4_CUCSA|nr:hypothetical protein Csa_016117 [Cucumis sativus]
MALDKTLQESHINFTTPTTSYLCVSISHQKPTSFHFFSKTLSQALLCLSTPGNPSHVRLLTPARSGSNDVVTRYKNARLNLTILNGLGASVLHGVDATKMKYHTDLHMRKFDRIIFNFPHAGFFGRGDSHLMIRMHNRLVRHFVKNASRMLRVNGEIHVDHKTKPPFSDWNIVQLAYQNSLTLIGCADFNIQDYPGYHNKRGQGNRCDCPFFLGECSTFNFSINHSAKRTPRLLHINNTLDIQRNLPYPEIPISSHSHLPYPTSFESSY